MTSAKGYVSCSLAHIWAPCQVLARSVVMSSEGLRTQVGIQCQIQSAGRPQDLVLTPGPIQLLQCLGLVSSDCCPSW